MMPRDLYFTSWEGIWQLFWLIPLLGLIWFSNHWKKNAARALVEEKLQPDVIVFQDKFLVGIKAILFSFGFILAIFALMGPRGNEYYEKNKIELGSKEAKVDLFILLDVSQSMAVKDMRNQKTRLEWSKEVIDQLISKLKSDSVALYAFTTELVPIVPLTYDQLFSRLMLNEIDLNAENYFGTNLTTIFNQLNDRILENYPKSSRAIVLFSDGEDNTFEAGKNNSIIASAVNLKTPIFAVGTGTSEGGEVPGLGKKVISKMNESLLQDISEAAKGRYFSSQNETSNDLAVRINQSLEQVRVNVTGDSYQADSKGSFREYFQIPLAASLLFFILYWFFPEVKKRKELFLLLFAAPLCGADTGETLFEAKKFQEASDWFSGELTHLPPEWLRNKLLYNLGVSLMQEGKGEEADIAFFSISGEAYAHPIFRLRLIYNQALSLLKQDKAQEALFILQLYPDAFLGDLKVAAEEALTRFDKKKGDFGAGEMIRQLRLASLIPSFEPQMLLALQAVAEQNKELEPVRKELNLARLSKNQEEMKGHLAKGILALLMDQKNESPAAYLKSLIYILSLNEETFLMEKAKGFYPFLLDWQKKRFLENECQCQPWDEAIPLFSDGLQMAPYNLDYTYEKWWKALNKIKQEHQGSNSSGGSEEMTELREMQALDKKPLPAKMKAIGEEMPW